MQVHAVPARLLEPVAIVKVLGADSMRELDRLAMAEWGIPALVLMENAAAGATLALLEFVPLLERVHVFCGPGNNGGDGLAMSRRLLAEGIDVEIVLFPGRDGLSPEAEAQAGMVRSLGLNPREVRTEADLREAVATIDPGDAVVDALFGTGLSRPLSGLFALAAEGIAGHSGPRVALDLPSGLFASSATVPGPAVSADLTVAFAALKIAHALPPACDLVGEVRVASLGFPESMVERVDEGVEMLDRSVSELLPERRADSHKGTYGHALLAAGAPGTPGAAILAARAALRSGCGLLTVAGPGEICGTVVGACPEAMFNPLGLEQEDWFRESVEGRDAVAIGPGLGRDPAVSKAIRAWVADCPVPFVLDADGLNAFEGDLRALSGRASEAILTPHVGELARLTGRSRDSILEDRLQAARRAAEDSGCVVVLKGHRTLIAAPEGRIWVNPTGNPGMATAGSGDVLTGILLGLLAQGLAPVDAACLGTYVHGSAGDRVATRRGPVGLIAGDLVAALPETWTELAEAP